MPADVLRLIVVIFIHSVAALVRQLQYFSLRLVVWQRDFVFLQHHIFLSFLLPSLPRCLHIWEDVFLRDELSIRSEVVLVVLLLGFLLGLGLELLHRKQIFDFGLIPWVRLHYLLNRA